LFPLLVKDRKRLVFIRLDAGAEMREGGGGDIMALRFKPFGQGARRRSSQTVCATAVRAGTDGRLVLCVGFRPHSGRKSDFRSKTEGRAARKFCLPTAPWRATPSCFLRLKARIVRVARVAACQKDITS